MHTTVHPTPKTICLGLDIAKAKLDACLLHSGMRHRAQFDNTPAGLRALLAWLRPLHDGPLCAVMESTGSYSLLAATALYEAGHHVSVINPRWIKDHARSDGRRNKTDTLDAEVIAHYGLTHDPDLWQPASPAQAVLRALLRRLAALGELAAMEARRAETSEPVVGKSIARLQKHIAREAAAWCGLTPRLCQSGSSVRGTSTIGREGNRFLRKILYMPALVARRANPRLKAFADSLEARGKSKMSALLAVEHKLLRHAFALLKHQSAYDPDHHPLKHS